MSECSKDDLAKLEEKIKELEEKNQKLERDYLYLLAELDNMRKYMMKEIERARVLTAERILLKLIDVYENMERAISNVQNPALLEGLMLIQKDILKILEDEGVKRIEALGKKFDPFIHEAVEYIELENVEDGMIVEEVSKGYMLGDKVLRPSRVKVAKQRTSRDETSINTNNI